MEEARNDMTGHACAMPCVGTLVIFHLLLRSSLNSGSFSTIKF